MYTQYDFIVDANTFFVEVFQVARIEICSQKSFVFTSNWTLKTMAVMQIHKLLGTKQITLYS